MYIHERENWTNFTWNHKKVMIKLGEVRNLQGRLLSKMESLGFDLQKEASGGRSTNYELKQMTSDNILA